MTTQIEMFPAQEADRAQAVLNYLLGRQQKAEKALATAEENLNDVELLITKQEHVLKLLRDHSVTQATDDETEIVEDAEVEEEELPAIDGVAVTPEGIEFKTATGEIVTDGPVVYVIWPDGTKLISDVGEYTRYGELIADGIDEDGEEPEDFYVAGPIEVHDGEEMAAACDPSDVIPQTQWGLNFRVLRKEAEASSDVEEGAKPAEEPWEYEKPEPARAQETAA